MKIYVGKNKLKAKQTTIFELIESHLDEKCIKMDNGSFGDGSGSWICIKKIVGNKHEIAISIGFDYEGENIDSIDVYKTEIVTILDEENSVKLT